MKPNQNKTKKHKPAGQSPLLSVAPGSPPFNLGQWIWCEHKLQQIKEMEDDQVTCVTDGYLSISSRSINDRCFPMDIRAKLVSEEYAGAYDRLHKTGRGLNLNFPDIHRWFVAEWAGVMQKRHDDEAVKSGYERLRTFERELTDAVEKAAATTAGGLRLFRS